MRVIFCWRPPNKWDWVCGWDSGSVPMADCTTYGLLAGAYQDSTAGMIFAMSASTLQFDSALCHVLDVQCSMYQTTLYANLYSRTLFSILASSLYNDEKCVKDHPHLSPCLACDEHFCGPEFLTCAGANRRRVGIVSDLQRHEEVELCDKTDWDDVRRMSHDSSSPPAVAPQPNPSSPQNHHHEDL